MGEAASTPRKAKPLVLAAASLGSMALGLAIASGLGLMGPIETDPASREPDLFFVIFFLVTGAFLGFLALGLYGLAYATACFTFDYDRSRFLAFNRKRYATNLVVQTLMDIALGCGGLALFAPVLMRNGVSEPTAVLGSFLVVVAVAQVGSVYVNIWRPVVRSFVRRRMQARALAANVIDQGQVMGTSDPNKSTWKKFSAVEEDIGLFIIEPHRLLFRGDKEDLEARRDQIVAIEREVDSGATASYMGARNVLVRCRDANGAERVTRLHPQDAWLLWHVARDLDALDARLRAWLGEARASEES